MVIHSNRLLYIMELAKDLQSKGEDVDEMLKKNSKSDGYEQKVIAHVYYGPTTETGKEKIGLNRHADEHRGYPNRKMKILRFLVITSGPTEPKPGDINRAQWRFIFKVYSTGTILSKFRVSAKGDLF